MTKEAELLWAKHKYLVLSKSQKIYLDIRQTLKSPNCTVLDVQSLIDQAVLLEESPSQVTNAYLICIYGAILKIRQSVKKKKNF